MNSMTPRWRMVAVCSTTVLAMLALGGCGKKAPEQQAQTTEEVPAEAATPSMVGAYTADLLGPDSATHKVTLTLNADSTAAMSMEMGAEQPPMVENGTWVMAPGGSMVDVSFQKEAGGVTNTVTLNFAAAGDTLTMTNAAAAGFGTASVKMVKQMAGEAEHTH